MKWNPGSATVLIADDDAEVCELLSMRLGEFGVKTTTVGEGFEASKFVENQKFSVIILDLNLPIMKGLQIAARARASRPNRATPIYIVSGFVLKDTLVQGKAIGVSGIFAKPFALNGLVTKILESIDPGDRPIDYDPKLIKCFVAGSVEVLKFYFTNDEVRIGTPVLRNAEHPQQAYASAVIPFTSPQFAGSMSLGLPVVFIKKWITRMFDDPEFKIDAEVIGSVTGELCNQMLGVVGSHFNAIGVDADSGMPSIQIGKDHKIKHKLNNTPIMVPISFGDVGIELEFCLSKALRGADITVGKNGSDETAMEFVQS